ncbi:amino acid/polyamine transporter I, partial [Hyaloscypha finlandica]
QRRDLGVIDVAALIINKQIGTGIFTTPGLVLSLTGSKTTSIIMWFCGGIWAFLCVIIYVEFGSTFPFNGGELIYLDEVLRQPELLATVLFSAFFIFVPNTDGNSLQFAKHILLASNPTVTETTELDKRLISYVAISILTVVSFIHYFSRNSGLLLNLLFAIYKVVLVIVLIICGCVASKKPENGWSDWGQHPIGSKNVLAAMIYIIYSYQGWENANYVGGELKIESRALKWGAFLAVGITTVLYTLVVMAFSLACSFEDLAGQDLGVVSNFAPKAFGRQGVEGIKVCIALSAFGNLIAVVYTSSKVKQQIARQCIIPFYNFFARDDKQFLTPGGALILHWVMAVVWILSTPNTSNGYGFVIGLFIYGQLVVG